jgi:type III pantothenate kinase
VLYTLGVMDLKDFLLIDIGNSTTVLAEYHLGVLSEGRVIPTNDCVARLESPNLGAYRRIVVSSVVPGVDVCLSGLASVCFVNSDTIPILRLNIDLPKQVGADRLVTSLAAYSMRHEACLIIDSGTALTFCYVDSDGVYQGGSIVPGMGIASQALSLYTAKIPLIHVAQQEALFGKTTTEAVQTGLYHGYRHLINGFIKEYRERFPKIYVVGTGAGLLIMKDALDLDLFDTQLTLKGLAICADNLV